MPDLIPHPENQLFESTWIPVPGSSPGQASPEWRQKKINNE
jgi:hypothetical protein